jgi:hypothetical protein
MTMINLMLTRLLHIYMREFANLRGCLVDLCSFLNISVLEYTYTVPFNNLEKHKTYRKSVVNIKCVFHFSL